jgi:hypothetical protein
MRQVNNPRSRLARQENKKMAKQTVTIFIAALVFLILFFWVGIPGLINLAITLGNSKTSSKFSQDSDTIPPSPPQINLIPVATSSATIDISGFTESGATVHLYKDGSKTEETTADNLGNFAFLNINLSTGTSSFYTQSIDQAGNQSQISTTQTIKFDDKPPTLTIENPADGKSYFGLSEQLIDVDGQTDADAIVFLNDRQLVVTGDGAFSTNYELKDGTNQLKFTAVDQAGNKSETEISVNYSR